MTTLTLAALRHANVARDKEWNIGTERVSLSYRGNELAGEAGEACNVIKKLERVRLGIKGSVDTTEHLAEELADIVICSDLIAMDCGINLAEAIEEKFNATSAKVGLKTRLAAISHFEANVEVLEANGYKVLPAESAIGDARAEMMILELERRGYRVYPPEASMADVQDGSMIRELERRGYKVIEPGQTGTLQITIDARKAVNQMAVALETFKKEMEVAAQTSVIEEPKKSDGSFASVIPALLAGKKVIRGTSCRGPIHISDQGSLAIWDPRGPYFSNSLWADDLRATDWRVID